MAWLWFGGCLLRKPHTVDLDQDVPAWGAPTPSGERPACNLPHRDVGCSVPCGWGRQEVQSKGRWAPSLLQGWTWVGGRGPLELAVTGRQPGRTSRSTGKKSRTKQNPEAPCAPPGHPTARSWPRRSWRLASTLSSGGSLFCGTRF